MMKLLILLSGGLLLCANVDAQMLDNDQAKKLMGKIAASYSGDNYVLSFNKKVFQSKEISVPMEDVNGKFILGRDHQYRLEEKGTLIIQNKQVNLVIDSAHNEVFVNKVDLDFMPIEVGGFMNDSLYDLHSFNLSRSGSFNLLKITSLQDKTNSIEMKYDPRTFQIKVFKYFFPQANYFSETMDDETVESPVMVVSYENISREKIADDRFDVSNWILGTTAPIELNTTQTRFELYDLRPESHQ